VATAARPRLLVPGLVPYDPARETYRVRPGAATLVTLRPDDRLTIRDPDGGQRAEVTVVSASGEEDYGALGQPPAAAPATVLRSLAGSAADGAAELVGALAACGLDPTRASALELFGESSPPGREETFRAERAAIVVVGAPAAGASVVDGGVPASDLQLELRRATPNGGPEPGLPEPLAEPRLDFQVDRASALAYEVRAGEFVQVIDAQGRQCSDFLAFHAGKLQAGKERGLDSTTTRSLMGQAYPMPGLHGKFYDQDQEPLVEVVRDTVGRHDTFGLACTAKYYEDMGYFGHVNCSENFNAELLPYTIEPRKGWPALNLFYNTGFDRDNLYVMDEPWSRPGDYVLLRAMTDLVCLSSACPDDIDPANAWNPTEVHVRVYPAKERFSAAIAHRVTPAAEPKLTRETGFHEKTSALTQRFTEYNGYWLPTSYDNLGAVAEYWACRERAAIMDLSPLRKFEVLGPDAEALLQWAVTRDVRRLADGQVVYTALCNDTGGMIDDGTVFRLGRDNFRWIGGSEYGGVHLREQAEALGLRVWVKESTDDLHNVAVQGPASRELLTPLIWTGPAQTPFAELRWFRFSVARLGGPQGLPLIASRTGYSGELGYELFCHPKDAPALWDAVLAAGEPHGLVPLGLEALDMLRIEAGLIFAGYEFDDQVDPFEAGIGFTVTADKEDDFLGREALAERRAHPQRLLVGLELEGNEPGGHGDCVHVGRHQVGVVTSGTRSPTLRTNIALCRMNVRHAEVGTEVEVGKLDGHQKRIPATVVRFPFYDPEKTRPRS
jgi:glycine cleavage system T protein (aminomethyltransferase)